MAGTRRRAGAGAHRRGRAARRREPARWRALLDDARARAADARGRAAEGPGARAWLARAVDDEPPPRRRGDHCRARRAVARVAPGGLGQHVPRGAHRRRLRGVGDLHQPLNPLQVAGIWPNGDFRNTASPIGLTYCSPPWPWSAPSLASCCASAAVGPRSSSTSHARSPAPRSSTCSRPRRSAKALAAASPAVPFAALIAAFMLLGRRRWIGVGLAVVVTGGILWSDALGYHDVWLAPRRSWPS